jgi:hypothetical protein
VLNLTRKVTRSVLKFKHAIASLTSLSAYLHWQSTTILPSYLQQLDNADTAVVLLVKARWNEHMVEDVLLAGGDGISDDGYQEMLMKHKLARAQLEVEMYSNAIANVKRTKSSKLVGH